MEGDQAKEHGGDGLVSEGGPDPEPEGARQPIEDESLVDANESEGGDHWHDALLHVPPRPDPNEAGQGNVVDEADVGVEAVLDVLPIEFRATSTDPEKYDASEDQLGEGPSDAGDENFDLTFAGDTLND